MKALDRTLRLMLSVQPDMEKVWPHHHATMHDSEPIEFHLESPDVVADQTCYGIQATLPVRIKGRNSGG